MPKTYSQTRDRIQVYFDQTAVKAWEALTNESPVSAIRSKVRAGRQEMRELLLSRLPKDLTDYSEIENKIGRIRDLEEMSDGSLILINDEYNGGVYRLYKNNLD